ncbi:hypothetical protein CYLTODRAFT_446338 [Cylindrobasidium torrendii FP15055 ss-10]|uniref:Uncharacterized protein n=1 Tax=Cylindrobasidium torrendii FP15055 ss-10 TaxID=1314674 RepID=A0A0D7B2Y6_9AGAR|nr:hypothetical protein CYLTODRAFT_446338 [Cylindrobasidium torrendii FP15055 ss-10]
MSNFSALDPRLQDELVELGNLVSLNIAAALVNTICCKSVSCFEATPLCRWIYALNIISNSKPLPSQWLYRLLWALGDTIVVWRAFVLYKYSTLRWVLSLSISAILAIIGTLTVRKPGSDCYGSLESLVISFCSKAGFEGAKYSWNFRSHRRLVKTTMLRPHTRSNKVLAILVESGLVYMMLFALRSFENLFSGGHAKLSELYAILMMESAVNQLAVITTLQIKPYTTKGYYRAYTTKLASSIRFQSAGSGSTTATMQRAREQDILTSWYDSGEASRSSSHHNQTAVPVAVQPTMS